MNIVEFLWAVWRVIYDHLLVNVAAAIVLLIVVFFWRRVASILSRLTHVPVAGKWTTQIMRGTQMSDHEIVVLHQFGSRVWGETRETTGSNRTYRIHGRITGEKLCFVYKEVTGPRLDAGAIFLQIRHDGIMEGYEVSYDFEKKNVATRPYQWKPTPH